MNAIALLGRYAQASFRGQLAYPGSTLLLALGQFLANIIEVGAIWLLFDRFGAVRGWAIGEVCLFFGMVSISFTVADFLSRGFDVFGTEFVRTGAFDRILLRPRSAALQLIGHEFRLSRAGRLLQGMVLVGIATTSLKLTWDVPALALAAWTVAGGVALFFGLLVLQAVLSFWTVESLEAVNALTYGGVQAAQYPLSLYPQWFRGFLTFVVPLGCVAYFPVLAILGKPDPTGAPDWLLPLTPAAGFLFLAASFWAWKVGVGKYTSTGS
jgi:ABC-2 type transport system permease protein